MSTSLDRPGLCKTMEVFDRATEHGSPRPPTGQARDANARGFFVNIRVGSRSRTTSCRPRSENNIRVTFSSELLCCAMNAVEQPVSGGRMRNVLIGLARPGEVGQYVIKLLRITVEFGGFLVGCGRFLRSRGCFTI